MRFFLRFSFSGLLDPGAQHPPKPPVLNPFRPWPRHAEKYLKGDPVLRAKTCCTFFFFLRRESAAHMSEERVIIVLFCFGSPLAAVLAPRRVRTLAPLFLFRCVNLRAIPSHRDWNLAPLDFFRFSAPPLFGARHGQRPRRGVSPCSPSSGRGLGSFDVSVFCHLLKEMFFPPASQSSGPFHFPPRDCLPFFLRGLP